MRSTLLYAAAAAGVAAVVALGFAAVFTGAAERRAIIISAALGWAVQLVAFVAVRAAGVARVIPARVGGAALRFAALVAYALFGLRPLGLPPTPALLTLATVFLLLILLEPRFLLA